MGRVLAGPDLRPGFDLSLGRDLCHALHLCFGPHRGARRHQAALEALALQLEEWSIRKLRTLAKRC